MRFKIQIIIDDEHGDAITEDVFVLNKSTDGENLVGISLSESKQVLKRLQHLIVSQQAHHYTLSHRHCPCCEKQRRIKDTYLIQYRTLFGIVPIPNQRLYHCACTHTPPIHSVCSMTGYPSAIARNCSILRRNGPL